MATQWQILTQVPYFLEVHSGPHYIFQKVIFTIKI